MIHSSVCHGYRCSCGVLLVEMALGISGHFVLQCEAFLAALGWAECIMMAVSVQRDDPALRYVQNTERETFKCVEI